MKLTPAKCPNCGGFLSIDSSLEAAKCSHCGCPFLVEEAINNYNITNNISAGVVNIVGGNAFDERLKAADAYLKLGKYDDAKKTYLEVADLAPQDYRGWVGLVMSESHNLSLRIKSESKLKILDDYYSNSQAFISGDCPEVIERISLYLSKQREVNDSEKKNYKKKLRDLEKQIQGIEQELNSLKKSNSFDDRYNHYYRVLQDLESKSQIPYYICMSLGLIIGIIGLVKFVLSGSSNVLFWIGVVAFTGAIVASVIRGIRMDSLQRQMNRVRAESDSFHSDVTLPKSSSAGDLRKEIIEIEQQLSMYK